jgi:hypothetical protein
MKEYVVLPAQWRSNVEDADDWVQRALTFARTLPAKQPKSKKS